MKVSSVLSLPQLLMSIFAQQSSVKQMRLLKYSKKIVVEFWSFFFYHQPYFLAMLEGWPLPGIRKSPLGICLLQLLGAPHWAPTSCGIPQVIRKAESRRIDAFKLWCWRRLLRVPWTARRSNQSILKEFNPEYSLEGLKLKLKLQYLDHLMRRADSSEKTLMLGKIEGRRRRGLQRMRGWMASPTRWT